MANKTALFKESMKNKRVAVLGIGISHLPLIRFLAQLGARVTAYDKRNADKLKEELLQLKDCDVAYRLGDDYLEHLEGDVIFKTPGMRFDVPQLLAARRAGSVVTSEMEVFFDLCPAPIFAVTGSDGKTTTTTLIAKMLSQAGHKVWLGGNIGNPLLSEIDKICPQDKVVLELSSFQLHTMKASPSVAVVTNVSPNHLDMHKDMAEYVSAKKNIFLHQNADGKLVLNYDNAVTKAFSAEAVGSTVFFSRITPLEKGVSVIGGVICVDTVPVLKTEQIKIPGVHNIENYMAAIAAVWGCVKVQNITQVAESFAGVAHRIELVRELNGVRYYNSSIDSSPNRTKNTLAVFDRKVILISGGKDKGIAYDEIGPVIAEKVKKLILIGATAEKIHEAVLATGKAVDTVFCSTYEEVVQTAREAAKDGDIVVLSPASTSFDMFKNFEVRGDTFKKLVGEL